MLLEWEQTGGMLRSALGCRVERPHLVSPLWPWQHIDGIFQLCSRGSCGCQPRAQAETSMLLMIDW